MFVMFAMVAAQAPFGGDGTALRVCPRRWVDRPPMCMTDLMA